MRFLEGAFTSDGEHVQSLGPLGLGRSRSTSFIRRCWYPERGCEESSTCSDLRELWEGIREDVKVLPPADECGRTVYITTGSSRTSGRMGVMDETRLETLLFPGEKWHKCCIIPADEDKGTKTRFICEHLKQVPRQKIMKEMKGWCGPHKCINPRDRCLIVDEVKEDGYKAKNKGECPLMCKKNCNRLTQKFECVYIGNEPEYGKEGNETPEGKFNEPEQYDVFALKTTEPDEPLPGDDGAEDEAKQACAPLVAALLPLPNLAHQSRGSRHRRWSAFLG